MSDQKFTFQAHNCPFCEGSCETIFFSRNYEPCKHEFDESLMGILESSINEAKSAIAENRYMQKRINSVMAKQKK